MTKVMTIESRQQENNKFTDISAGCFCVLLSNLACKHGIVSYSYLSATIGSTPIARRAGK